MSTAPTRAERALATRRRMLKAAYELFCTNGYLGTTISSVANAAGVAVPTLYYTFGTKAALLSESLGAAIVGFDVWREPPQEPVDMTELLTWNKWWADFESAPTAARALDLFITHGAGILERVGPLVAAMHGASGDPEAAEVVRTTEERRVDSYRTMVRVIARKPGGLRRGVTEATATDIVVALFSAELYQAFTVGRRWSPARCTAFFREILAAQLLDAPDATSTASAMNPVSAPSRTPPS
jgi:AcrR family transcriptional regulator